MKNHIEVEGKRLQTNKKWRQLKRKQKESIAVLLRKAYMDFVSNNGRKPSKDEKKTILENVYSVIVEKEIWISKSEVGKYLSKKIMEYNKSLESVECSDTDTIEEDVKNDPIIKIAKEVAVLKTKKCIKDFSVEDKNVKTTFPELKKSTFIKPPFNEREAMDAIKRFNATTIRTLNCIIEGVGSNNEFPTQKQIANIIGKDISTVCKCMAKLKKFNIVYKNDNGKYNISEMSKTTKEKIITIVATL